MRSAPVVCETRVTHRMRNLLPVLEATLKRFLVGLVEFSVDDRVVALDKFIDHHGLTGSDHGASDPETRPGQSGPSRDATNSTPRNVMFVNRPTLDDRLVMARRGCDVRFFALVERLGRRPGYSSRFRRPRASDDFPRAARRRVRVTYGRCGLTHLRAGRAARRRPRRREVGERRPAGSTGCRRVASERAAPSRPDRSSSLRRQ